MVVCQETCEVVTTDSHATTTTSSGLRCLPVVIKSAQIDSLLELTGDAARTVFYYTTRADGVIVGYDETIRAAL